MASQFPVAHQRGGGLLPPSPRPALPPPPPSCPVPSPPPPALAYPRKDVRRRPCGRRRVVGQVEDDRRGGTGDGHAAEESRGAQLGAAHSCCEWGGGGEVEEEEEGKRERRMPNQRLRPPPGRRRFPTSTRRLGRAPWPTGGQLARASLRCATQTRSAGHIRMTWQDFYRVCVNTPPPNHTSPTPAPPHASRYGILDKATFRPDIAPPR